MKPSLALKLKDLTLAQEARVTKRLEDQARRHARRLRERAADPDRQWARGNLPGAVASNATPAVQNIVAAPSPNQHVMVNRLGLYRHRVHVLRPEARDTHLARGFLNGTPYEKMESFAYTSPDWAQLELLVNQYREGDARVVAQHFAEWIDDAKKHCGDKPKQYRESRGQSTDVVVVSAAPQKGAAWVGIVALAATFIIAMELLMFFLLNWRSSLHM